MASDADRPLDPLVDALDRFGPDIASWPDRALADAAWRRLFSDAGFRAEHAAARAVASGLTSIATTTDAAVVRSAAASRLGPAVFARIADRGIRRTMRWAAAAAITVAAGLGSLAQITLLSAEGREGDSILVLEPMFVGPVLSQ